MEKEQDGLLSRLASKAKRKLNKESLEENTSLLGQKKGVYEFVKSDRETALKKLEKKIVQLLKNNPDCVDPIGKLIDHKEYDNLSDERKQAYILKLSKSYRDISLKLSASEM